MHDIHSARRHRVFYRVCVYFIDLPYQLLSGTANNVNEVFRGIALAGRPVPGHKCNYLKLQTDGRNFQ